MQWKNEKMVGEIQQANNFTQLWQILRGFHFRVHPKQSRNTEVFPERMTHSDLPFRKVTLALRE